ncbi:MAG TPA: hypothetical protein VGD78_20915 [Chthoniobacterales bacterium]
MSTDGQPSPSRREKLRPLAQDVMRHTERGKGVTYAGDISSIVQSARQLADMVLELTAKPEAAPPAVEAQPAVEAPPPPRSFREIEKYGMDLRARAPAKYPDPTPEQRQKIEGEDRTPGQRVFRRTERPGTTARKGKRHRV